MEEEVLGLRNPDRHTRVGTVCDIRVVMDIGEEINDGKELDISQLLPIKVWFGLCWAGQSNFQIIKKFHGYFTVVCHEGLVWCRLGKNF